MNFALTSKIFFFEGHFFVTQTMPVVVWSQRTVPLGAKLDHHTCSPMMFAKKRPTQMKNTLPSGSFHMSLSVSMVPVYHFALELCTESDIQLTFFLGKLKATFK